MRDYILVLLLVACVGLYGYGVAQEERLQDQLDSLNHQVRILQADTEDLYAVQGWHTGRMDDISQRGRGQ